MQTHNPPFITHSSPFTIHDLKIIFMGTPEFAVASLDTLVNEGFNVVGVVTAPDKPAGRGMKLNDGAVKKYAFAKGLKILQSEKLKDPNFLNELKSLNADLQVVVAFRMLPEAVWNMPPLGTINVHASLLPQYRGAAPINWAIINGEKETGVTTFKLQHEIDTGNILLQEKISIGDDETAGELHDRMKVIGAKLLVKTIQGLADGTLKEIPQSSIVNHQSSIVNRQSSIVNSEMEDMNSLITHHSSFITHHSSFHHAPKIFTETCKIDWHKTAEEIHNLIRGLSPYPAAFTFLNDKLLKIFRSKKEIAAHYFEAGSFHTDKKTYLKFACTNGFIHLLDVQLEGKKRLLIEDFLRGYKFES